MLIQYFLRRSFNIIEVSNEVVKSHYKKVSICVIYYQAGNYTNCLNPGKKGGVVFNYFIN